MEVEKSCVRFVQNISIQVDVSHFLLSLIHEKAIFQLITRRKSLHTAYYKTQGEEAAQIRQSAKLFFMQVVGIGTPQPLNHRRVCPHPHPHLVPGGHTRLRERGGRVPIPTRVTYTVVLFIYTYFVGGRKPPTLRQRRQKIHKVVLQRRE
jgi:hypothetical protein